MTSRATAGPDCDRRDYDDARNRLADESERLRGEAAMLNEWNAEINTGYRARVERVCNVAGRGQRTVQRRSDLCYEHETLTARRDRLRARRRQGLTIPASVEPSG